MTDIFYQLSSLTVSSFPIFLSAVILLSFLLFTNFVFSIGDCYFSFLNALPTYFQLIAVLQLSFASARESR